MGSAQVIGAVRVIRSGGMPAGPASQGMTRKLTEIDEHVGLEEARNAPQTMSGWHHHGERTAYVYVVQGQLRIELGPGGREHIDVTRGDFYVMPPNTIHREGNPGSEDQVLVACFTGSGPIVVNVAGPAPEA